MKEQLMNVMQNDTLVANLAKDHDYKRSLAGDKLMDGKLMDSAEQTTNDAENSLEQAITDIIETVPWEVWVIILSILLAFVLYRLYASGMLGMGFSSAKVNVDEADNIYEIDFEKDTQEALAKGDYATLLRLVYLRTLRSLDEAGRIVWRIYKTPSQYDAEMGKPAFHQMTHEFVKVRYGKYPADKALYEQMLSWQRQVMEGGAI